MGLFYELSCPKCGYYFEAFYMYGGAETTHIEVKKRLENGSRDDEPAIVYRSMVEQGTVSVEADSRPYWCSSCRSFFNYNRVIIRGQVGKYIEEAGICPTCKKRTWQTIECEKFEGKGQYGDGECECECPKCQTNLTVTSAGVAD